MVTELDQLKEEVARLTGERDALKREDQRREMYLIATLNAAERSEKERDAAVARAAKMEESLVECQKLFRNIQDYGAMRHKEDWYKVEHVWDIVSDALAAAQDAKP